jgi:hypothetical protein
MYILLHKQHPRAISGLCYIITAVFFFLGSAHKTSIAICDPKGSCLAEGCIVTYFRVQSVLTSTLCTLTCTVHPSDKQYPFGSYIDTDVCVRSPEKQLWLCNRGGSSLWDVVCAPICTYTWWCVIQSFYNLSLLTFMPEVRRDSTWNTCWTYKTLLINSLLMACCCHNV